LRRQCACYVVHSFRAIVPIFPEQYSRDLPLSIGPWYGSAPRYLYVISNARPKS
jgi:hypothetical protein